jgi:hypothetical protein
MLPYQKIGAISVAGELSARVSLRRFRPRPLNIPEQAAGNLAAAMALADRQRRLKWPRAEQDIVINCHLFVRMLSGMQASFDPPFATTDATRLPRGSNLSSGEIGIVGDLDDALQTPYHAVLGLGEEVPESLQFLWGDTIGICENSELLRYMNSISMFRRTALFRRCLAETE